MSVIEFGRRRLYIFVVIGALLVILLYHFPIFSSDTVPDSISPLPLPGWNTPKYELPVPDPDELWDDEKPAPPPKEQAIDPPKARDDLHPIANLTKEADQAFRKYEGAISQTFRHTLEKYRSRYGRHPPPGFQEWYKFARKRNVYNIDDFEQIMDDLRPFWAAEPAAIRAQTAYMWEDFGFGVAMIHIRNHEIAQVHNEMWRTDVMSNMIKTFIEHIPDMDIPMNRLDQPRVAVQWEDMQVMLQKEYDTRAMAPEAMNTFTEQGNLTDLIPERIDGEQNKPQRPDAGWFFAPGRQYMDIAKKACPPESPARSNHSIAEADALYKNPVGGFVNNFNLSSDLCTVGPAIQDLHGMLYSASSIIASHKLVPIFGECKTNINNDILFPANMYYTHDDRYDYSDAEDVLWKEKADTMIWRGVTSGGVQNSDNWQRMHRQRLVQMMNSTHVIQNQKEYPILAQSLTSDSPELEYQEYPGFHPSAFARSHSDIGFTEPMSCVPDCHFYDDVFSWKSQQSLTSQFRHKYLIDVDGHSFSGRWHAFLQSRALGFKATIFREWHDSRLFAWRHFVPVDNRYDDLYGLLTYFMGYGESKQAAEVDELNPKLFVPRHDAEAKRIARQGREWAMKVLRREDIEVYMFRLLLEYARVVDDNRDRIGYSGDGSELDKFDQGVVEKGNWGFGSIFGNEEKDGVVGAGVVGSGIGMDGKKD